MPERAQQHGDFVLCLQQVPLVDRLCQQHLVALRAEHFEICLNGNHDEVVLRSPEHASKLFSHSDHFERHTVDLYRSPNWVAVWEKRIFYVRTDKSDVGVTGDLILRDACACVDLHVIECGHIGSYSLKTHALKILTLESGPHCGVGHHS